MAGPPWDAVLIDIDGALHVGPDPIEGATGRPATVTGKPSAAFFAAAVGELNVAADGMAMIGDDIEADVGGAIDAGLDGVLVQTGKFHQAAVEASGIAPTLTLASIADLIALFLAYPPIGLVDSGSASAGVVGSFAARRNRVDGRKPAGRKAAVNECQTQRRPSNAKGAPRRR